MLHKRCLWTAQGTMICEKPHMIEGFQAAPPSSKKISIKKAVADSKEYDVGFDMLSDGFVISQEDKSFFEKGKSYKITSYGLSPAPTFTVKSLGERNDYTVLVMVEGPAVKLRTKLQTTFEEVASTSASPAAEPKKVSAMIGDALSVGQPVLHNVFYIPASEYHKQEVRDLIKKGAKLTVNDASAYVKDIEENLSLTRITLAQPLNLNSRSKNEFSD